MNCNLTITQIFGALAGGLLLLSGCSGKSAAGDDSRLTLAVGIPPQASLLREIVGDSAEVVTLLRPDSNPETFEPSVNDMKRIYGADAYFTVGQLPFEQSLVAKIAKSAPDMQIFDSSQGIELLYGTHDNCSAHHHHAHAHAHDGDSDEGIADPHIWSSARNLRVMATNMYDQLVKLDPDRAEYYTANYERLTTKIDSIDNALAEQLAPVSGSAFLIWHPSLSYFAKDYGLEQLAVGQENKDSSVRQFREKIDHANAAAVKAFFIQRNMDASTAENLVRQIGVKAVEINPLDADWENQLNIVANAISQ